MAPSAGNPFSGRFLWHFSLMTSGSGRRKVPELRGRDVESSSWLLGLAHTLVARFGPQKGSAAQSTFPDTLQIGRTAACTTEPSRVAMDRSTVNSHPQPLFFPCYDWFLRAHCFPPQNKHIRRHHRAKQRRNASLHRSTSHRLPQ